MRKRVKVEKKKPLVYHCPHCNGVIEPAKMMAKNSVKARDVSPDAMRKLVQRRWNRVKLYGA